MVRYKKTDVTVLMVFVFKSTIGYLIIGKVDQRGQLFPVRTV